jgi:hypothetical protein
MAGASEPRAEWCPTCCKTTVLMVDIHIIDNEAAYLVGGYGFCHECGWSPYAEKPGSSR